jgi:zinc transporter 1/2/3
MFVTLVLYKVLSALLVFLISVAAVVYPLRKKGHIHTESLELGEALASGIFLGAAFFHMLPEAIHSFSALYPATTYPVPELICIGGFILMLFLERLSIVHAACHPRHTIPYVLTIILVIHALVEGAALGMGETFYDATLLLVAIIAHKGSESFALCVTLLRYALPRWQIWPILIFFAAMTPLGIMIGTEITNTADNVPLLAVIFKSFAAGTFLYISILHHVRFHEHTEERQGLLEFGFMTLGLAAMGLIAVWV